LAKITYPELFIKNSDTFFSSPISGSYPDIARKAFPEQIFYIQPHFLPKGRAYLDASASLLGWITTAA
jgi:hypothetical protein